MKRIIRILICLLIQITLLPGCGRDTDRTTVTVFAAKSLSAAMDEIIELYTTKNPDVVFITNYDSSGTLQVQIEEGATCDVFFSAAELQVDRLIEDGLVVDGTRCNIVGNKLCLVTTKGSGTLVTGISDIEKAESIALAGGRVPAGGYTRVALVNAGKLEQVSDPLAITTEEISDSLNGVSINECANVGAVAVAVAEGSNEVGTIYYSDYKCYEDKLDILEILPCELTGDVVYPAVEIANDKASRQDIEATKDFLQFLTSDEAKAIFEKYYFDVNVN